MNTLILDFIAPSFAAVVTTGEGAAWLAGGMGILALILAIAALALVIWAIVDLVGNPYLSTGTKIIIALAIFFFPLVGAIAYLLLRPTGRSAGTAHGGRADYAHA